MKKPGMREYTKADLLALTPARYLAAGFVDGRGKPLTGLQAEFATAAATQLLVAELSPQELNYTYEALRQSLVVQGGAPPQKIHAAVQESLQTVGRMIQQPNNPGLAGWMHDCEARVKKAADIEAFLVHFLAVLRQYSVFVASLPS